MSQRDFELGYLQGQDAMRSEVTSIRTALSEAVEALEGCWARLKTDRAMAERYVGLGKVYDAVGGEKWTEEEREVVHSRLRRQWGKE